MPGLLVLKHVEAESSINFESSKHMRLKVALLAMQTKMLRNKTAILNLVLVQVNLEAYCDIDLKHCLLLDYIGMHLEYEMS